MSQTSDVARTILVASLKARAAEMREHERRARGAYRQPGPLRDATVRLADIYARAAELFEQELGQLEFVDGTPPDPDPQTRPALDLDAMNRGRAAVGMPPLSPVPPVPDTAKCWSGKPVYCKGCGGKTVAGEESGKTVAGEELSGGREYEVFSCVSCRATTHVELPD